MDLNVLIDWFSTHASLAVNKAPSKTTVAVEKWSTYFRFQDGKKHVNKCLFTATGVRRLLERGSLKETAGGDNFPFVYH